MKESIIIAAIDQNILLYLNSMISHNYWMAQFVNAFAINPLLRGLPVFGCLIMLWFFHDNVKQRTEMLTGLIGTSAATILSVFLQHGTYIHTRPLIDPALNIYVLNPEWAEHWTRLNSFPSDTASLFFGLTAVVFFQNRRMGCWLLIWCFITSGLFRVILGWHYPSDVLGSLFMGFGLVFLLSKSGLPRLLEPIYKRFSHREYIIHTALFLLLADAYNLFNGLNGILQLMLRIGHALAKSL